MADACLFCRIVAREIPATIVAETSDCLAFRDLNPQAPLHVLVIPKRHVAMLSDAQPGDAPWLGRMLALVPRLMKEQGVTNGFRTVINTGPDGGQEVYHLHLHAFGGPRPWAKG